MTTEVVQISSEGSSVDLQKSEWVTVREATIRDGISEKSVYNRINSGYYASKVEDGKKYVLIQKRSGTTEAIQKPTERSAEAVQDDSVQLTAYLLNRVQELTEETTELKERLSEALELLTESREMAARLQGEMSGKNAVIAAKDETIQAKDQAINAANAAVMLIEQRTPSVDAEAPKQIETTAKKPAWKFW